MAWSDCGFPFQRGWTNEIQFSLIALGCCLLSRIVPTVQGAESRPNVVIVLADDQGYGDFSCYGNPILKTPNLDRLREQCVRFTDFHVTPMCTPTRGELMSGQDAVRNGATSVTGGRSFMRPNALTMPELFAGAGYSTGLFGKWHLGDNYPNRPTDHGFQKAVHVHGWGFTSAPEFSNTLMDGRYFENNVEQRFKGYCTDFWFDRAMQWMKEQKEAKKPFLCYMPLTAPHMPLQAPKKYTAPYDGMKLDAPDKYYYTGKVPAFFGMIANIDENMLRLENFLQENGLRENTILIYFSDNGAHRRDQGFGMQACAMAKPLFTMAATACPAGLAGRPGSLASRGTSRLPPKCRISCRPSWSFAG